jgi:hypothetical protein
MPSLNEQLAAIDRSLDDGSYRPGPWQAFLDEASRAPREAIRPLEHEISRVSDKLHGRSGRRTYPWDRALAFEILGALAGLLLLALGTGSLPALILAAAVLATTFQPLLKVAAGLTLGVGYSYAYLAHGEPRFKLRYGSYLAAPPRRRILFHLSGALGTPLGLYLVSAVARPRHAGFAAVLFWIVMAHLLFQAVLLILPAAGVRRLPGIGPLRLTSAGGAGEELRHLRIITPARSARE